MERIAAVFDDDLHLVLLPKSDLIELLMCAIVIYKLSKNNDLLQKYKTLYTEYTTTSIYEEKAEEALLSLVGIDDLKLIVRKNLRDAYLTQGDQQNAGIQETIIEELLDKKEGVEND